MTRQSFLNVIQYTSELIAVPLDANKIPFLSQKTVAMMFCAEIVRLILPLVGGNLFAIPLIIAWTQE